MSTIILSLKTTLMDLFKIIAFFHIYDITCQLSCIAIKLV